MSGPIEHEKGKNLHFERRAALKGALLAHRIINTARSVAPFALPCISNCKFYVIIVV